MKKKFERIKIAFIEVDNDVIRTSGFAGSEDKITDVTFPTIPFDGLDEF